MLIRLGGTRDTMDQAAGPEVLFGMWAIGGIVLGSIDWAINRPLGRPRWRSRSLGAEYEREFDIRPRFKAAANVGPVTVAEVGVVKRDVAYLSDVLNTAARLQSKCNEVGHDLLISRPLLELLPAGHGLSIDPVGTMSLRGREEEVEVYAVDA